MYLVVYLYLRLAHDFSKQKFRKTTRFCSRRHDTKRERPAPPSAESGGGSKVRHAQETARRKVDLSLSYLGDRSKPGLNRTLRLLSCKGQHFYICISKGSDPHAASARARNTSTKYEGGRNKRPMIWRNYRFDIAKCSSTTCAES